MTPRNDVLVIGAGVIGLSIAAELAARGVTVTLLGDDGPRASAAAAGMLCPAFERLQTGGRTLAAMGKAALDLWDGYAGSLCADPGIELGYARLGTIGAGYPPRALPGEPIDVPGGIEADHAVLVPGEGQVDPRLLLGALEMRCAALGVTRRTGRAETLQEEGDRITGATLTDGDRLAAGLTVAAGGVHGLGAKARLRPVRGRAFLVPNVLGLTRVLRTPSVYLAPKGGDTLYLGATEEEAGLSRDGPAAADGLWSEACWLAPALASAPILARFDGLRPGTIDELPIVGPDPVRDGLLLALGHHRNGVLLAPLTAATIADQAVARLG